MVEINHIAVIILVQHICDLRSRVLFSRIESWWDCLGHGL